MPMFALSWVITYFAHVIPRFETVTRIFDFILGTQPIAIYYLTAAVVMRSKEAVMKMHDLPDLHVHFATELGKVDWDEVCAASEELLRTVPPAQLITHLRVKLPYE